MAPVTAFSSKAASEVGNRAIVSESNIVISMMLEEVLQSLEILVSFMFFSFLQCSS